MLSAAAELGSKASLAEPSLASPAWQYRSSAALRSAAPAGRGGVGRIVDPGRRGRHSRPRTASAAIRSAHGADRSRRRACRALWMASGSMSSADLARDVLPRRAGRRPASAAKAVVGGRPRREGRRTALREARVVRRAARSAFDGSRRSSSFRQVHGVATAADCQRLNGIGCRSAKQQQHFAFAPFQVERQVHRGREAAQGRAHGHACRRRSSVTEALVAGRARCRRARSSPPAWPSVSRRACALPVAPTSLTATGIT